MTATVILCNANLPLHDLDEILKVAPAPKLVCSTHLLFEREKLSLTEAARRGTVFKTQDEYFTDSELWEIDRYALQVAQQKKPVAGSGGFAYFRDEMLEYKSALLLKKLQNEYTSLQLYVVNNLGVPASWWVKQGATEVVTKVEKRKRKLRINFTTLMKRFYNKWRETSNWIEICFCSQNVVLLSSATRIITKINAPHKPLSRWQQIVILISKFRVFPYTSSFVAACTIHDYKELNYPNFVLQDGHYPSNYSAGHLWEYQRKNVFIPSNPFAEQWFISCGLKSMKISGFNDPLMKPTALSNSLIKNVLFAMGHAGDWSALISRSNTCRLILAVKDLANSNQELCIKVRFHPTMTNPEHDGIGSFIRLKEEIDSWGLSHVSVSFGNLQADLDWADVVISEYSQVMIDAWVVGKLGIILNLTGRRSFMKDYENLGFINVNSITDLINKLRLDPYQLVFVHNQAVNNYNLIIKNWSESL